MSARLEAVADFLAGASALKDCARSAYTPGGLPESVAAHSWRLALLGVLLADEFEKHEIEKIDVARLLSLLIVHDLGEALSGDVPAIGRDPNFDKSAREREDISALTAPLPADLRGRIRSLWEEYEAGTTPEAAIAKGLDKCETMLTHAEGANPSNFDYAWNLGYGVEATARHPLVAAFRDIVDRRTRARIAASEL